MKLRIRGIITIVITLAVLAIAVYMLKSPKETIYKKDVTVYSIEDNLVTCIDANGEEWFFLVTDDSCVAEGQDIKLVMNDKASENPYDDEVVDFTYVR